MENKSVSHQNLAKHTHEMLIELSHVDPLTGLLNRRGYQRKFEEFYSHAARTGERLQIVLLDMNDFRGINKKYKHAGGDEALKAVANAINATFRTTDAKVRWGGDEFLVLTLNKPDDKDLPLDEISGRLNAKIEEFRPEFMQVAELKATVGLVTWNGKESEENLFERVDELMMSKKENE